MTLYFKLRELIRIYAQADCSEFEIPEKKVLVLNFHGVLGKLWLFFPPSSDRGTSEIYIYQRGRERVVVREITHVFVTCT